VIERKLGNGRDGPLVVRIDGGSTLEGDLIVEDADLDVKVYLRSGGRILGEVRNAELIREDT
jgi:hypothetical protein